MEVIYKDYFKIIVIILSGIVISSCASTKSTTADVNVEKIPSNIAHFDRVIVTSTEANTDIYGVLHKRHHSRTVIPGYVDIVIMSPNGDVLHKLKTDYHRPSIKSRQSKFHASIPMVLPPGSVVRLIHLRESEDLNENNSMSRLSSMA